MSVVTTENYETTNLMECTPRDWIYDDWEFVPSKYLTESVDGTDVTIVEGVFQRSDTKNANGRIYPRSLWEKVLNSEKCKKRIAERSMFGECDHPESSRTSLQRVSHLITGLTLGEDGVVYGRAELLNTPNGRILKALTEQRAKWAVSSRGQGSVNKRTNIVQEDFDLDTFDAVASPSTPGAYPKPVRGTRRQVESQTLESNVVEAAQLKPSIDPKSALVEANQFILNSRSKLITDSARKIEQVCALMEHEAVILQSIPKDHALSDMANEVLKQLRESRVELEESVSAVMEPSVVIEGEDNVSVQTTQTDNSGDSRILQHKNQQLEESVMTLQESLDLSQRESEATKRLAHAAITRLESVLREKQNMEEQNQVANDLINSLVEEIEQITGVPFNPEDQEVVEESAEDAPAMSREEALELLLEAMFDKLQVAMALTEDVGDRYLALEELAEAMIEEVRGSLKEAAIEESLAQLPESAHAKARAFLNEAPSAQGVEERFSTLLEAAQVTKPAVQSRQPVRPAQRQAAYQDRKQPLPTPDRRVAQTVGSNRAELTESVQNQRQQAPASPQARGIEVARMLSARMSGQQV